MLRALSCNSLALHLYRPPQMAVLNHLRVSIENATTGIRYKGFDDRQSARDSTVRSHQSCIEVEHSERFRIAITVLRGFVWIQGSNGLIVTLDFDEGAQVCERAYVSLFRVVCIRRGPNVGVECGLYGRCRSKARPVIQLHWRGSISKNRSESHVFGTFQTALYLRHAD